MVHTCSISSTLRPVQASGKISHMIETTRLKQERVQACKQRLRARMDQNAARINQVQADVANCSQHDAVSSEVSYRGSRALYILLPSIPWDR